MSKLRSAIITGTGIYSLPGLDTKPTDISTPFGTATVFIAADRELVFLARHGHSHATPPHRINYRANMWALHQLGVHQVLAAYAVGSLQRHIGTGSLVLLQDFLDWTDGRAGTFYDGEAHGVGHADMTRPYCRQLCQLLEKHAAKHDLSIVTGSYACTNGPRLESALEVRMLAEMGCDVVGMTGVPEVCLARELGLHFAAVGLSMNYAVGLEEKLEMVWDLGEKREALVNLFLDVLQVYQEEPGKCCCLHAVDFLSPPKRPVPRATRAASAG